MLVHTLDGPKDGSPKPIKGSPVKIVPLDGADEEDDGEECDAPPQMQLGLGGQQVMDAGLRVTRLMGRAMAAKEAGGKALGRPTPESLDEIGGSTADGGLQGMHAVARFRRKVAARRSVQDEVDDDDDDAMDD